MAVAGFRLPPPPAAYQLAPHRSGACGLAGGNPKSEIPNPNWAGGREFLFLIPNSSFLIHPCSSSNLSRTFAAWPFALTFFQWCATRPSGSMSTVERMTPTVVLPYMLFSPQAP
jgi:hypothetical protein